MKKIKFILLAGLLFMATTVFAKQTNYEVHFLDTGQSDCILIKADDRNYIIDTGAKYYTNRILAYLNNNNISTIDGIILTHYHDDHYGGLLDIVNKKKVQTIFLPSSNHEFKDKFYKELSQKGVEVKYIENNHKFKYKKMKLTALVPDIEDKDLENNNSVILQGEVDKIKYIFAGDCEKNEEEYMIQKKLIKRCDVLKVPHHGLNTGCSDSFLAKINPKIAIVTSNGVETPDLKVINRICKKGIKVLRTDLEGNLVIKNDILKTIKGDFKMSFFKD